MTYDKQILQILSEVGQQGIGVRHLAKHVYNMNCTLFEQPDWDDVYKYVLSFLRRCSHNEQSLIEPTGKRGYYRLNIRNNADARQLVLEFQSEASAEQRETDDADCSSKIDLSLSLFD